MTGSQVRTVAPPLPPGTRPVPGYEILGHLARTNCLDLYDSWSGERDCRCVIKVLRPDRRGETDPAERLLREGRWLCGFTHPHLVRAYETFERPEPLVVLETLSGETLAHLVHRLRRPPAAADVAVLGAQLCSAVHYLHGRGLLHLDIKPSNVVVERGHAKVLDLSLARPPGPAPRGVGTYSYLSPEQARGDPLTTAADVWGVGVTLYEVACGHTPFDCHPPGDRRAAPDGQVSSGRHVSCAGDGGRTAGSGGAGPASRSEDCGHSWYPPDDSYPQVTGSAPPIATRRRLPRALAAVIDGCLRADPAARPTVPQLATAFRTFPGRG